MDHPAPINILSLCTGGGGIELGLKLVLGEAARTVCYVEREAYAAAVLASRMEDKGLDAAPVWSDLKTFDGKPWRGTVDLVTAGFPCQPFSHAGAKRGHKDPRHLWPDVVRIIQQVEPAIVLLENVPGILSVRAPDGRSAATVVCDDLRDLGYDVEVGLFSAAETLLPHRRQRVFFLAHRKGGGFTGMRESSRSVREAGDGTNGSVDDTVGKRGCRGDGEREDAEDAYAPSEGGHCCFTGGCWRCANRVADSGSERRQGDGESGTATRATGRSGGAVVGDAQNDHGRWGECGAEEGTGADGIGRRGSTESGARDFPYLHPPGPGDRDAWQRILEQRPDLAPATQREIRGVASRMADELVACQRDRVDRLRLLGNGVVPVVAAVAFVTLWTRLANHQRQHVAGE